MDKLKHIIAGAALSTLAIGFLQELGMYNFLVVALIGAAKEIVYDKMLGKGTPEFWDFAATCLGVAMVMVGYLVGINN